jgi:hypothetical protein
VVIRRRRLPVDADRMGQVQQAFREANVIIHFRPHRGWLVPQTVIPLTTVDASVMNVDISFPSLWLRFPVALAGLGAERRDALAAMRSWFPARGCERPEQGRLTPRGADQAAPRRAGLGHRVQQPAPGADGVVGANVPERPLRPGLVTSRTRSTDRCRRSGSAAGRPSVRPRPPAA